MPPDVDWRSPVTEGWTAELLPSKQLKRQEVPSANEYFWEQFLFFSDLFCPLKSEIHLKRPRGYWRSFIWGHNPILVILNEMVLPERGSDGELIHIFLWILWLTQFSLTAWEWYMKMHRHPMPDWSKMFSSMAECGAPERQFLLTALCWLTDSVCSYSGMWNESGFQLLYLFFVSSVDPFAWHHFLKTLLLDCTVNITVWELSLLCTGAQCRPVQHMEHITVRSHLLK